MTDATALDSAQTAPEPDPLTDSLRGIVERQKRAFFHQGPPSLEQRVDRLDRAVALLVDHRQQIAEALEVDFGHRSHDQSLLTDVASAIEALKYARKSLPRWLQPERHRAGFPFGVPGGRASVHYQPLGVVGIVASWTYPVYLTFAPLASAIAAGNRCVVKPSEMVPATADLIVKMLGAAFDQEEVAVAAGGTEVVDAVSRLPLDHLLFIGSAGRARQVMRSAAANLVPVSLELGGKNPAIIGRSASIDEAADKILTAKLINAGQSSLAPDTVFVPDGARDDFVAAASRSVERMYKTLIDNPDYSSVLSERHLDRLNGLLDDAEEKGAEVIVINPAQEDFHGQHAHKMAPTLVLDAHDDMHILQEEILGPALPIVTYRNIKEVIDSVNGQARPLVLYYLGSDDDEERRLLERTTSGGMVIGDVLGHLMMEELTFGGVGDSGRGPYLGHEGSRPSRTPE